MVLLDAGADVQIKNHIHELVMRARAYAVASVELSDWSIRPSYSMRRGRKVIVNEASEEHGPVLRDLPLRIRERDLPGTEGSVRLVLRLVFLVSTHFLPADVQIPRPAPARYS